jgi:hypothetical protein
MSIPVPAEPVAVEELPEPAPVDGGVASEIPVEDLRVK